MGATVEALKEHYGITLSASVINKVTRQIGKEAKELNVEAPASDGPAALLVVEIDGSMVPVVKYGELGGEQKGLRSQAQQELLLEGVPALHGQPARRVRNALCCDGGLSV